MPKAPSTCLALFWLIDGGWQAGVPGSIYRRHHIMSRTNTGSTSSVAQAHLGPVQRVRRGRRAGPPGPPAAGAPPRSCAPAIAAAGSRASTRPLLLTPVLSTKGEALHTLGEASTDPILRVPILGDMQRAQSAHSAQTSGRDSNRPRPRASASECAYNEYFTLALHHHFIVSLTSLTVPGSVFVSACGVRDGRARSWGSSSDSSRSIIPPLPPTDKGTRGAPAGVRSPPTPAAPTLSALWTAAASAAAAGAHITGAGSVTGRVPFAVTTADGCASASSAAAGATMALLPADAPALKWRVSTSMRPEGGPGCWASAFTAALTASETPDATVAGTADGPATEHSLSGPRAAQLHPAHLLFVYLKTQHAANVQLPSVPAGVRGPHLALAPQHEGALPSRPPQQLEPPVQALPAVQRAEGHPRPTALRTKKRALTPFGPLSRQPALLLPTCRLCPWEPAQPQPRTLQAPPAAPAQSPSARA